MLIRTLLMTVLLVGVAGCGRNDHSWVERAVDPPESSRTEEPGLVDWSPLVVRALRDDGRVEALRARAAGLSGKEAENFLSFLGELAREDQDTAYLEIADGLYHGEDEHIGFGVIYVYNAFPLESSMDRLVEIAARSSDAQLNRVFAITSLRRLMADSSTAQQRERIGRVLVGIAGSDSEPNVRMAALANLAVSDLIECERVRAMAASIVAMNPSLAESNWSEWLEGKCGKGVLGGSGGD